MKQFGIIFLAVAVWLQAACTVTEKIPPKPDYNSRSEYTDLIEITPELQFNKTVQKMEVNQKSLRKMGDRMGEISSELGCKKWGVVKVSIIITKDSKVDAPIVITPLNTNCDKAVLIALRYLKYEKPTRVNGKPVNTTKVISFLMNNPILTK